MFKIYNCGDGQREEGRGLSGGGQRWGNMVVCNSVNNKNKVRNEIK